MTAAPSSPQQIRDRLLQAIDPQSNIRNMVAVLEVISSLEKYPITKEALEETRLGKLINDVRKKTKNEELAKRAKKLLRNWQKLIEPVHQNEAVLRGLAGAPGSANGGAHNCRPEAGVASAPKSIHDLKNRNDIQRLPGLRLDRLGSHKRRGDQRDLGHLGPPPKVSKVSHDSLVPNSSPLPTNGIGGSPESFPGPLDSGRHVGPEGSCLEQGENDKHSIKIPINAVRPHTSSPGLGKPSGPCLQSKAAVLQQLDRADETSGPPHPKGPPRCSFSPRNSRHEGSFARQRSPYSPKGSVPSPLPRPQSLDVTQVPSPLPLAQPSTPPVRRLELLPSAESPVHWLEQPEGHQRLAGPVCKAGLSPAESILPRAGFSPDSSRADSDAASSGGSDSKKKRKQSRDYTVNLGGQVAEAGVKPVRLKERKLTFDPMTRQIKPLTQKEPVRADSPVHTEQPRTELDKPEAKTSLQSPFEQTNWKELSRNEIIQSYLSRQSSLLSSSGAQTPGAHHFMSEYLKQEESTRRGARTPHVLLPPGPSTDLPGLSRQVTQNDLDRIQAHQWPGVNGCQDTQENFTFLESHPQSKRFPQVLLVCKAVLLARRPVCALETLMTIPLDSFALWLS
ncbi:mediator of RNA polymerase II transcription subunit 26 isoform X1 [Myotis lucifugus]|uniref:mediator of RNA polymerase II transcription subunit 26 isoform X1 n=2 Tax=Myotis lucifugus TaxID=59463 RepID=UPI0006D71082|nr:mediator of RNA polymerase II transcription subunit 26 isoform X1 [Myotis lucifugus]